MMLKFSILVYLPRNDSKAKESLEGKLKNCLSDCNAAIQTWNISNFHTSEVNPISVGKSKPAFGDLFFEVFSEVKKGNSYYPDVSMQYSNFCKDWFVQVPKYFPDQHRPLLHFKDNKAYSYDRSNCHKEVSLSKITFGTLVSPTHYVSHYTPNQKQGFFTSLGVSRNNYNIFADFMHDSAELNIEFRELGKNKFFINRFGERKPTYFDNIKLRYGSIKHIIVNGNYIYLELMNQPTVHRGFKRVNETNILPKSVVGRSNTICITVQSPTQVEAIVSRLNFRCAKLGTPVFYCPLFVEVHPSMPLETDYLHNPTMFNMDFSCLYLIEALTRRNCKLQLQNFQEFLNVVKQYWIENSSVAEEALSELVRLTDTGHSYNYLCSFEILYHWHMKMTQNKEKVFEESNKTMKIRRAIVTPTKILLWPPEISIQNRIIRNFDKDYALRVSFRDEDYSKINYRSSLDNVVIKEAVTSSMLPGIFIGNRHFNFLAWSNSQIRDHGVWMYAVDKKGESAASIRRWMGDFSAINCVSKYMARMGQCFSQTQDSKMKYELSSLHGRQYQVNPDIERGLDPESGKAYCFSDGIGKISSKAVAEILVALNIKGNPSAFQIRFAGFKGMLVLDPTAKDCDIVFRKSMEKFSCNSSKCIEICKVSAAGKVALNRPLITILNQNGIKNHVFLRLQEDALQMLTDMFFDDEKAGHYLSGHQNLGLNFKNMTKSGISSTVEPFFRGMLLAAHLTAVDKILNKANLPIDPSEGRNMFGVLDETGTLNYGQVFVQYTKNMEGKETNEETVILKGPVLITKNPCYQAGDVRVLWALDVPNLRHIKDCIVFPQNGDRPHPNEMAGSDLDGDEYTVIWKKGLIFPKNDPPSHFPCPTNPVLYGPIKISDMINFLCDYISFDNIGRIASAHLAFADHMNYGIRHPMCQNLARKCSIAVDFAKNGVKVDLHKSETPPSYPDFMVKGNKDTYKSKRSLGVLYRTCRTFCEYTVTTSETYLDVNFDPHLEYNGWQKYRESAIIVRDKYNDRLETILMTYGIKNESEAMTSCFSKLHGRYNYFKDKSEIEELIKLTIEELVRVIKKEFSQEFVNNSLFDTENALKKASAWYMVTYTSSQSPRFLSFPWVVAKYLCQIKLLNLSKNNLEVVVNPVLGKYSMKLEGLRDELISLNYSILSELRKEVSAGCPLKEWECASQMLIMWARYNDLTNICNLDEMSVIRLLIHAYKETPNKAPNVKAISLIIMFLKFFMSLRFKEKGTGGVGLPFYIDRLNVLAKESMTTYRHVAITGTFESFGNFANSNIFDGDEEMDSFPLSGNAKGVYSAEHLQMKLREWSKCEVVVIREDNNSLIVSAWGSIRQIQKLRNILNKGPEAIANGLVKNSTPLGRGN